MALTRVPAFAINALFLTGACAGGEKVRLPDTIQEILEKAEQFELLSLDPNRSPEEPPQGGFHDWKVLGKTLVKNVETRKQLINALNKGIEENLKAGKGTAIFANCFHPRHGLKASHKGKAVELLICFECFQVVSYLDGKELEEEIPTSSTQQAIFDKVLQNAKVPLAPKAKDQ